MKPVEEMVIPVWGGKAAIVCGIEYWGKGSFEEEECSGDLQRGPP